MSRSKPTTSWAYDVPVEGVKVDIEYTTDRDIETGESWTQIETVQIGGVDAGPLLYAINAEECESLIQAALAKHINGGAVRAAADRAEAAEYAEAA